jgi:polysaccharide biosynthesis/export protein
MKSGNSTIVCRDGAVRCVLAVLLAFGGITVAQQTAKPGTTPSTPPADPAARPIAQAAESASGAQSGAVKVDDAAKNAQDQSSVVKLGVGDLIEVGVYNVPEMASKVRISTGGDIYLPLIDYVHVDGLTQEEAQALIEKRLSDGGFVRNPHVTIFVDEATSQGVTVLGEVSRPGIYPDTANRRLYDVLSQAGGFTPQASRKLSILRRGKTEAMHLDLPRNLADDVSGNVDILPGDTISIPRAPIIYVVGDVGRPSGLLVDNGTLTVLQALALAGGTNKTAKLSGARIIHKGVNGSVSETKVEIKKMLEAKSPDVTLQADDILFVPISGGKVLASRTFEAAMSAATAVTIYSVHP